MAATREDISNWFDRGVQENASHMIVACDTYDWSDYPIYVHGNDPKQIWDQTNHESMTKCMECYALWKPKEPQLNKSRVYDFEPKP